MTDEKIRSRFGQTSDFVVPELRCGEYTLFVYAVDGLVSGAVLGLGYMALGYTMYVALGGGSFAAGNMLGEMLLGSAVGAVTGAVRANMHPRRSRIRHIHS